MTCTSCGAANRAGRKFCAECGTPLTISCSGCGAPNEPGERFCGECGQPLADAGPAAAISEAASSAQAAPETAAELKHVSVLFCDLVDFTRLSEQRDAEDVRSLLSAYFDTARRIVERYGGTIEKFIGDAVMAVWGTPVTREDDAQRAVRAALDLVETIPTVGEEAGVPQLAAKAGVATGQVASWAHPGEGLVVGDRVNTAARIQSSADPQTVFVDDVTRQATSAAIAYTDRGAHTVKGKTDSLRLWQALRVVGYATGEGRMDGLEGPLVGRSREMTMVKELFHGSVEDGRAWLVAMTGQAGVGKSRLHWELRKYVDGLAVETFWHTGRCLAYGDGVAYSALSEMVRQRFGVTEDDPPTAVQQKLADGFVRWIPDTSSHAFLAARLGALLGIEAPSLTREDLFAGWRMLFEQLAAQSPVALIFEDMQWADSGLLDFIESLLDWSADHRIFILTLARPDLTARHPQWAAGRRNATPVYVDPLNDTDMSALLDDLVTGLSDLTRQKICQRAEGLPLYAVESVRGLIDRGVVVAQDGEYVVIGDVGDLDVPPTLTALIAARIDALEADERALVRGLSVLGTSFPRAAIPTVTDLDEASVDSVLTRLMRKDILTLTSDPLSPDRGQYRFVQALLKTAAYDSLGKAERKEHHLNVAEHLRHTFPDDGDDIAEVIAAHYTEALRASRDDPESSEIRRSAVEMYIRSARRAATLGAPEKAEQAYLTARDLTIDAEQRVALTQSAGTMCTLAGRAERAVELFSEVIDAHLSAGRDREAAVVRVSLAEALRYSRRLEDAFAEISAALAELPEDDLARAGALATGSWVAFFAGHAAQAFSWADDALLLAQQWRLDDVLKRAVGAKALACSMQRPLEALALYRWQLELFDDNDAFVRGAAHHNVAEILVSMDQPGARAHLEAEREICVGLGDRLGEAIAVGTLMEFDMVRGAWDEAETRAQSTLASRTAHVGDASIVAGLALIAALRGRREEAHVHLDALTLWRDGDDIQDRACYQWVASALALADGEYKSAVDHGSAAVDALHRLFGSFAPTLRLAWVVSATAAYRGQMTEDLARLLAWLRDLPPGYLSPFLGAHLRRFEALQAAEGGAGDGVEEGLSAAAAQLRELRYPYDAALVGLDLAQWLASEGRVDEAQGIAADAADTFAALGAEPDLQRARALQVNRQPIA